MSYLEEQKLPHFKVSIPRLVGFQRGVMEGVTVDKLDRARLGWIAYQRVSDEILASLSIQVSE